MIPLLHTFITALIIYAIAMLKILNYRLENLTNIINKKKYSVDQGNHVIHVEFVNIVQTQSELIK